MLKKYSSVQVAAWWCFAVAAVAASALALGGAVATRSLVVLFAFLMVTPVAILMALWRSGPSPSMKDLLTAPDRGGEERR